MNTLNNETTWRDRYAAAMVELDPAKLQETIDTARTAIQLRLRELATINQGAGEEQQTLSDALQNLRSLQRVELERCNSRDHAGNRPTNAITNAESRGAL